MNKNRTATILLLSLLTGLVSCGGEAVAETSATDVSAETTPAETTSRFVDDSLPADLDFGGKTVTWFVGDYMDAYWDDFYAEEANGSRVNDAVYQARRNVEDRLNVKIEYVRKQVVYNDRYDVNTMLQASILAGDGAYDILSGRTLIDMVLEDKEYLQNLAENKNIDFTKPWWNQSQMSLMPGGAVYIASGDGSLSVIKHTYCMFFNKTQLDKYGIKDDIYGLVNDKKWTIDKLSEYVKLGYSDINGNSAADYGDEFALTLGDNNKYIGLQFALGVNPVEKTKSGYEIRYNSEKMVDIFEK